MGLTAALSLGVHAAAVVVVGYFALRSLEAKRSVAPREAHPPPAATLAMDLPVFDLGTLLADREPNPTGVEPTFAGGDVVARVDTSKTGHGGDPESSQRAIHLSDEDDWMRLSPDLISRLDRDQLQRLRTARERAAWEDRRATTHPTELTFLASGKGSRRERRSPSPLDPSRGALASAASSTLGGDIGGAEPSRPESEGQRLGSDVVGSRDARPGVGVHDGRPGGDHRTSAAVAHARPDVTAGPPTIPASARKRPNDTVDSDQEVASMVRSIVHASTFGGPAGEGRGGTSEGGDPGAGANAGPGAHPRPLGDGEGPWLDLETNDPRLIPYFRKIKAKIDPLWANAFPKQALLDLKQGMVILEIVVDADGSARVSWPPVRPSGIDEFDRNCADAVRRAAPFEPIPKELNRTSLRIRAPFRQLNEIVK
jgi:TonB family protein